MFDLVGFYVCFRISQSSKSWKDSKQKMSFLFKPLGDTNLFCQATLNIRNEHMQHKMMYGGGQILEFSHFPKVEIWTSNIILRGFDDFHGFLKYFLIFSCIFWFLSKILNFWFQKLCFLASPRKTMQNHLEISSKTQLCTQNVRN